MVRKNISKFHEGQLNNVVRKMNIDFVARMSQFSAFANLNLTKV